MVNANRNRIWKKYSYGDERTVFEIEAYKISTVLRPMIKFKANLKEEMHLEILQY